MEFNRTKPREAALPSQAAGAFVEYARDLQKIIRDLLFHAHVAPAQLQNLARRIRLDVEHAPPSVLLSCCEPEFKELLPAPGGRSEAAVCATGLQTACLLAFAAPRMFPWSDRTELLVAAALIQDTGLLLLERQYDMPPAQLAVEEPAAWREHPAMGASLSSALADFAVDLPRIIAQHHERCDGTGYPLGLRSDRLSAPSRFLAIAARLVELLGDTAKTNAGRSFRAVEEDATAWKGRPTEDAQSLAAGRLVREAQQGELDRTLTIEFLRQLGWDMHDAESRQGARHFQLARFGVKKFRIDGAENPATQRPVHFIDKANVPREAVHRP